MGVSEDSVMQLDLDRVRQNVAKATTEDLLDRATVFRAGMEPQALAIIDAELRRRGVTPDEIQIHWETKRADVLMSGPLARGCSFCTRPAVCRGWAWHRVWGRIPLFPRLFWFCEEHRK
jgi:hypothetical protein